MIGAAVGGSLPAAVALSMTETRANRIPPTVDECGTERDRASCAGCAMSDACASAGEAAADARSVNEAPVMRGGALAVSAAAFFLAPLAVGVAGAALGDQPSTQLLGGALGLVAGAAAAIAAVRWRGANEEATWWRR